MSVIYCFNSETPHWGLRLVFRIPALERLVYCWAGETPWKGWLFDRSDSKKRANPQVFCGECSRRSFRSEWCWRMSSSEFTPMSWFIKQKIPELYTTIINVRYSSSELKRDILSSKILSIQQSVTFSRFIFKTSHHSIFYSSAPIPWITGPLSLNSVSLAIIEFPSIFRFFTSRSIAMNLWRFCFSIC